MTDDGGDEPTEDDRALAADDHRPTCAGSATQSAVSNSGAARERVFCQENALAKAPW